MKRCDSTVAVAAMCALCTAVLSAGTAKLEFQERVGEVVSADFGPMPKVDGSTIEVSFGPIDYVMLRLHAKERR